MGEATTLPGIWTELKRKMHTWSLVGRAGRFKPCLTLFIFTVFSHPARNTWRKNMPFSGVVQLVRDNLRRWQLTSIISKSICWFLSRRPADIQGALLGPPASNCLLRRFYCLELGNFFLFHCYYLTFRAVDLYFSLIAAATIQIRHRTMCLLPWQSNASPKAVLGYANIDPSTASSFRQSLRPVDCASRWLSWCWLLIDCFSHKLIWR